MKQFLNALPLLIAIALLGYGSWQHDRSSPLGELWQVSKHHDGDTRTLTRKQSDRFNFTGNPVPFPWVH